MYKKKWLDYYSILQVHHEAEIEVIESAYKRLCKKYHPDLNNTNETEERMKLINLAYEILKNPNQRDRFHKEWLSRNRSSKIRDNTNDPKELRPMRVMKDYIDYISNNKYILAYKLISEIDKNNINLNQFTEWQKSVGNIYKIGNYSISHFKTYNNYHTKKIIYPKAIEFEIITKEKNLLSGKINEYSFTKLTVYDRNDWRVFLGYEDVELLIHKFKFLADSKEIYSAMDYWTEYRLKTDEATALKNKKGFLEECEKELYRYLRYGRKFSFSIFNFDFSSPFIKKNADDYLKQAAYLMKKNVRDTDIIGRWDKNNIIILFTETLYFDACKAAKKIRGILNDSSIKNFINPKITISVVEHTGQNINISIRKCINSKRF